MKTLDEIITTKDQDGMNEMRHAGDRALKAVKDATDSRAGRKIDEINQEAQKVKDKIQELVDRKAGIIDAPLSKAYILDVAKKALREKRKEWFINSALVPHLKDCQAAAATPFGESSMRVGMGDERRIWKMLYGIITEEDLEEAMAMLPDIGMSAAEKKAEIKKIDAEMAALVDQVLKEK